MELAKEKGVYSTYDGSPISKGNLPLFVGQDIGLKPSVIPGSYLEY